jgi:hypothetical protein
MEQECNKGKVKVHLRTGHEGPNGEQINSSFFNLGASWDVGQCDVPAALPPRKRSDAHRIGDWVAPRASLGRWGKPRPHRIRSPDRPALASLYTD